jgi:ATP-dependent RNA helicase DDX46/PRP5
VFVPPGRQPPAGQRRIHLLIEATSDTALKKAKTELRRLLEEETLRIGAAASTTHYAKYTVA